MVAVGVAGAGIAASLLGARGVARHNATAARQAFQRTAVTVASSLEQSISHDEDLAISASTFFAANPTASTREFDTWVHWARLLRRYPELDKLAFISLVRSPELAAFQARLTGHPLAPYAATLPKTTPTTSGTATPATTSTAPAAAASLAAAAIAAAQLHLASPSAGTFYCLKSVELVRRPLVTGTAGLDYCARTPGLLSSRDSAAAVYAHAAALDGKGLSIELPVYKGNLPPSGFFARRAAFLGWVRAVLRPATIQAQALQGHSGYATRMAYSDRSSRGVSFASGTPAAGAQSTTVKLHDRWTLTTFGAAPASAAIFSDGEARGLLIAGVLLSLLLGALVFMLGSGRAPLPAITLRRPAPEEPRQEALYDELTGLPNRALALDRAERMVARVGRTAGLVIGALVVDVDWFRDVNSKLGEEAGDQLLRVVSERLQGVIREGDTVARLGDDDFVILVEAAARGIKLDSLARRAIESLHKPVELAGFGPSFFPTVSIGVAFGRYTSTEDLLRDAHLALDSARAAGKGRYALFNANMRSVIEGRGVLGEELNAAVTHKQFFLLCQPVYDLRSRQAVELDALIRWQHPSQGILPPAAFMPLAEETGLSIPIGRWVIESACELAAALGVAGHKVGISVGVSTAQLNRDGFITDVRRALQQSGLEPARLTLEIDEATIMDDLAASVIRLEEVAQLGVRIAVDNFGNAYARRAEVSKMTVDYLKVDRSAIAESEDQAYRDWLLEAILTFASESSMTVIAKGVETYDQLTALQAMGCTMAQGVLLGMPTRSDAVEGVFSAPFPTAPDAELVGAGSAIAPPPAGASHDGWQAPLASESSPAAPSTPGTSTSPAPPASQSPPAAPDAPPPAPDSPRPS